MRESPTRQLADEHDYVLLVVGAMEAEAARIEETGTVDVERVEPDGRLHAQLHRRRPPHQGGEPPLPPARGAEPGGRRHDQRAAERARGGARLHTRHLLGAPAGGGSGRGARRSGRRQVVVENLCACTRTCCRCTSARRTRSSSSSPTSCSVRASRRSWHGSSRTSARRRGRRRSRRATTAWRTTWPGRRAG